MFAKYGRIKNIRYMIFVCHQFIVSNIYSSLPFLSEFWWIDRATARDAALWNSRTEGALRRQRKSMMLFLVVCDTKSLVAPLTSFTTHLRLALTDSTPTEDH